MSKIKLNNKFKTLIQNKGRINIVIGGRASGKSYSIALYILLLLFEKGHRILYTRYTMTSAEKSIIPEFTSKIEMLGLRHLFKITATEIINIETGSTVLFSGLIASSGDQTARLKGFANISVLVVDEAEELRDPAIFDKLNLSIRNQNKKNQVILILNPASKSHWIYQRYYQGKVDDKFTGIKDDIGYIHLTYKDIEKHLNQDIITQLELVREHTPDQYENVVLGSWMDVAEGVIFNNWSYGEFPDDVKPTFGLDFGFSNDPNALVATYVDNKSRKIYLKECLYQKGLTTDEFATILKRECGNNVIFGDSAEPRLIHELATKHRLNIKPCKKAPGSILSDISLIQNYELIVHPGSKNLVFELNNYAWNKATEKPIDKFNHGLDAFRYGVNQEIDPDKRVGKLHLF